MKIAELMTPTVGMVTDRDIAVRGIASDRAPGDCFGRDVMSGGVCCRFEEAEAEQGAKTTAERRVRRPTILDADKRLVGVLSIIDLARAGHGQTALGAVSEPTPEHRPRAARSRRPRNRKETAP